MKCKHKNKEGKECEAPAMAGSDFCYYHNPEIADKRKADQKKGGSVGYNKGLVKAEPIDISTDDKAIIYLLVDTINRVREVRLDGSIDVKTANAIGQLAGKLIEAKKAFVLEERLMRIEDKIIESRLSENGETAIPAGQLTKEEGILLERSLQNAGVIEKPLKKKVKKEN
jgi:hypothetical protein